MNPVSIFFLFIFITGCYPSLFAMIKEDKENLCVPFDQHVAKDCTLQSWMNYINLDLYDAINDIDHRTLIQSTPNKYVTLPPEIAGKIYDYVHDHLKKILTKIAKRTHPSAYNNFLKNIPERFRKGLAREALFYPQRWYFYLCEIKKDLCYQHIIPSQDGSVLYGLHGHNNINIVMLNNTTLKQEATILDLYHTQRGEKPEKVKMGEKNTQERSLSEAMHRVNLEFSCNGLFGAGQLIHDHKRNKLYIFIRNPRVLGTKALIHYDLKEKKVCNVTEGFSRNSNFVISADCNGLYLMDIHYKGIINLETLQTDPEKALSDAGYERPLNGDKYCVGPIAISPDESQLFIETSDECIRISSLEKSNNKLTLSLNETIKSAKSFNHSLALTHTGYLLYWARTNALVIHKPKASSKSRKAECMLLSHYGYQGTAFDIAQLKDPIRLPDDPATKQHIFFMNKKDIPLIEHFSCDAITLTPDNNKIRLFSYNELMELTAGFTLDQAHYLKYLETTLKDAQLKKENSWFKKLGYLLMLKHSNPILLKTFTPKHRATIDRYLYENTIGSSWYIAQKFFINWIAPFSSIIFGSNRAY